MKSDRLTDTSVQLSERTKEILAQADYSESYIKMLIKAEYRAHTFAILSSLF